jgi:hypothetical protein
MQDKTMALTKPQGPQSLIQSLDDILKIAEIAANSKKFPDAVTTAQAAVKILAGREIGLEPFESLRSINIINGRPEYAAGLLAALIEESPVYSFDVIRSDSEVCELQFKKSGKVRGPSIFTMDDARRAGLVTPRSNWEKYPKAMLFNRALTQGQRMFAAGITRGAAYCEGELSEAIEITPEAPEIEAPADDMASGFGITLDKIGALIEATGRNDSSGERRQIFEGLRQGAFQAVAQQLRLPAAEIVRLFGHLATRPTCATPAPEAVDIAPEANEARARHQAARQKWHPAPVVCPPITDPVAMTPETIEAQAQAEGQHIAAQVAADREAKAAEAVAPGADDVPLDLTATDKRAALADLSMEIVKEFAKPLGITRERVQKERALVIGRNFTAVADLSLNECQILIDHLETWRGNLRIEARDVADKATADARSKTGKGGKAQ